MVVSLLSTTTTGAPSAVASNIIRKTITKRVIIHWFRHTDLRLYDNQALTHSSRLACNHLHDDPISNIVDPVIPIFCFDDKIFGTMNRTPDGKSLKCGVKRAQFILESVANLRKNIQNQIGSQLFVAVGDPYDIVDTVLTQLKRYYLRREIPYHPNVVDEMTELREIKNNHKIRLDLDIVCQKEYATEEREAVIDMTHLLHKYTRDKDREIYEVWGSTLYLQNKSPFDKIGKMMPNDFRTVSVRLTKRGKMDLANILPIPEILPFPTNFTCQNMNTYLPTLQELGYTEEEIDEGLRIDPRNTNIFVGGESEALVRCHDYIFTKDLLRDYKFRRTKGTIMDQKTSRLSPYLSHGCISPRYIAAEAKRACINKGEYHLYLAMINWELIQRDYCLYYTVKHGKYIFLKEGPVRPKRLDTRRLKNLRSSPEDYIAWTTGQTGYPLVDAAMRELKSTGWMNNRCRLVVASFLFADLDYDWTRGADWFESNFIDYNVYSNWVSWCVSTGLNTGQQYLRYVVHLVGKKYDPDGEYVKLWVPELKDVPAYHIHKPWKMTEEQQLQYNARLGIDYPHPIRDPSIGDRRRHYRYLRRRGIQVPEELVDEFKGEFVTAKKSGDSPDEENEDDDDNDDAEDDSYGGEDSDEDDESKMVKEIKKKMRTSKIQENDLIRKNSNNTDDDWYSKSAKDNNLSERDDSNNIDDDDNESNHPEANGSSEVPPTSSTSNTKSKWRIDLSD